MLSARWKKANECCLLVDRIGYQATTRRRTAGKSKASPKNVAASSTPKMRDVATYGGNRQKGATGAQKGGKRVKNRDVPEVDSVCFPRRSERDGAEERAPLTVIFHDAGGGTTEAEEAPTVQGS
jgi:hypothetical protein